MKLVTRTYSEELDIEFAGHERDGVDIVLTVASLHSGHFGETVRASIGLTLDQADALSEWLTEAVDKVAMEQAKHPPKPAASKPTSKSTSKPKSKPKS